MIAPDRLASASLFVDFPSEMRGPLAAVLTEVPCATGQVIFSEGDEGDALYFIAEGRVAIRKFVDRNKGTFKILSVLGAGDFFGEMAFLEKTPRWASAVAQSSSTLFSLRASDLKSWMSEDARVPLRLVLPFVQSLNNRLRQSTREMLLLFDVGGVLAQGLDAFSLAGRLTEILARGFDESVSACFYLWNEFAGEYEVAAQAGGGPSSLLKPRSGRDPVFSWMTQKGECLLSSDWAGDPRFDEEVRSCWPEFKSFLGAPVLGERRPVGHLVFGHPLGLDYFTPTHRRILAGVVNLVAPAFESASLRSEREAQQRLARLRHGAIDF